MALEVRHEVERRNGDITTLTELGGDLGAAAISATLVAPLVTAIDRAVVENAASRDRPLLSNLKTHLVCSFRHPRLFFAAKPFFYVWTLYAGTYTTANASETLTKQFMHSSHELITRSITFLSTCLVNVPLGVWKDVRFAQIFGMSTTTDKGSTRAAPKTPTVLAPSFPKAAGAAFLFRDALTIAGSFVLAPMMTTAVPDSLASNPNAKIAVSQLLVPVLTQVVVTPVHLLGIDLYRCPKKEHDTGRFRRVTGNLGPATAMRCSRIIPAFGFGCMLNTELRDTFHSFAKT